MNKFLIEIKNDDDNLFFLINKKLLKTFKGEIVSTRNKNIAFKLRKEFNKYNSKESLYKSDLIKLLFYSYELNRKVVLKYLVEYLDTDTLCYRAEKATELELIQDKLWNPLLEYFFNKYNIKINIIPGIMPIKQPLEIKNKFISTLSELSSFSLCSFYFITNVTNSVIIALNILEGKLSIKNGLKLSLLEQDYNIQKWGKVKEANMYFNQKFLFLKNIMNFEKILKIEEK